MPCVDWRSSLAQGGRRIWWQPAPGQLVQVAQDGALVADREVARLGPGGSLRPGRRTAPPPGGGPRGPPLVRPGHARAPARARGGRPPGGGHWAAYAAQGLDRVYRWQPDPGRLERFRWSQAWSTLKAAPGRPPGRPGPAPRRGHAVAGGGSRGLVAAAGRPALRPLRGGGGQAMRSKRFSWAESLFMASTVASWLLLADSRLVMAVG